MNKTKIRRLATALLNTELASGKLGFELGYNQNTFSCEGHGYLDFSGHNCDTVACIAGWAVALEGKNPAKVRDIATQARKLLGLDMVQADKLFEGSVYIDGKAAQPRHAALTLFNLAETGKVDWSVAKAPQQLRVSREPMRQIGSLFSRSTS
jgi:hypothetical protein